MDSLFNLESFIPELTSAVDVSSLSSHSETNDKSTFNKLMRVMSQDFSIFASSWLGLISVNDEIRRPI